jgi:hypothetical protein
VRSRLPWRRRIRLPSVPIFCRPSHWVILAVTENARLPAVRYGKGRGGSAIAGVPDEMICAVAAAADTAFVQSGRRWSGRQQPGWRGISSAPPVVAAGNLPRPGPVDFGHTAGAICLREDESGSVVARVAVRQGAFRDQPVDRGTPLFPATSGSGNSARWLTHYPARPKAAYIASSVSPVSPARSLRGTPGGCQRPAPARLPFGTSVRVASPSPRAPPAGIRC